MTRSSAAQMAVILITVWIHPSVHIVPMRYGKPLPAWLAAMLLWAPVCAVNGIQAPTGSDASTELRYIVESGRLSGLRCSDFRDVQPGISTVYAQNGFTPLSIVNGVLTAKGRSIVDAPPWGVGLRGWRPNAPVGSSLSISKQAGTSLRRIAYSPALSFSAEPAVPPFNSPPRLTSIEKSSAAKG